MEFRQLWRGFVGCLKITEDKASDANLTDAEVAFLPQMWASCQTRGSHFNPNVDLASFVKRRGRILTPDANLASLPNAMVVLFFETQTSGSCFNIKMRACVASRFNSNASLSSSALQHRREPGSSASQNQSKIRVQRETCISAITDSHKSHFLST